MMLEEWSKQFLFTLEKDVLGYSAKNNSEAWKAGARYALQRVREEINGQVEELFPMKPELVQTAEICKECQYPRLRPDWIEKK